MSPAGSKLQLYFRKYPSLVNCTSIDWYLAWPDAALLTVSEQYLMPLHPVIYESLQYDKGEVPQKKMKGILTSIPEDDEKPMSDRGSPEVLSVDKPSERSEEPSIDEEQDRIDKMNVNDRVSTIMTMIHQKQIELASEFQAVKQKHVYVTPLMFAGMFKLLQELLARKNQAIEEERNKYSQGVQKLEEAKIMIDDMQKQLEKLKPVLEQKKKQVDATMKRLELESKKVEATELIVKKEEAEVKVQRDEADIIKNDCQSRLAIAEPHFTAAINALRCLSANDFTVIKSFTNPPSGVRLALEACCVMLGLKGKVVRVDNQKTVDFWEVSKKAVTNYKKLIDQLENYPKEDVDPEIIKKIQPYLANPDFQPEKIRQASEAAEGICKWVQAICKFDIVYKEITPKRIALEEANEKLKIVSQQLADKQAELQVIIDQKTQLELEFKQQNQEKEDLLLQRDMAQKKLDRANKLISSIGSERDRWISTKAKLGEAKRSLLGDMIIASAIITYLGPFDGKFRARAVRDMGMQCRKYQIEFSYNYSLKGVIADEEEVTDWLIKGLPNEQVCVDNMIIMSECKKTHYPVLIDPQGQALKFLQQYNQQANENVIQLKITQPNATYLLQYALQEGAKVIIENASEVTNSSLLSILRKETQSSVGSSELIKFNDQQIEFDKNFFCYILSQYNTPHFSPEVQQLSKVLDFSVTREGLEQQLLQIVCKAESAKEEEEREKHTKQGLMYTQQKKQIVNDILDTLRTSGKDILESDDLVNKLESSKQLTNEINHKLSVARHIEDRIEENRKILKPVAEHGARLYFAVQNLPLLDPMYQFSMKWFKDLFNSCFDIGDEEKKDDEKAEDHSFTNDDVTPPTRTKKNVKQRGRGEREPVKTKEMKMQRVVQLKKDFREILYKNVCMSLFETHKLLFAFYMSLKIFEQGESNESFAEKLKALDKINEETGSSKQFDSSSKQSDDLANLRGGSLQKKNAESKRGSSRVGGDERILFLKEDEKLKINDDLLNYTLTGLLPRGLKIYGNDPNPDPATFSEKMWKDLEMLTAFDCFEQLLEEITKNLPAWQNFMKADQDTVFDLLPEPYLSQLTYFALIPLMRALKPELQTATIRRYVLNSLGQFFVTPIIFQVNDIVDQSKVYTPMLLLLTPGNDPMEAIKKAAEERGKVPNPISLGKGQGDKAKRIIQEQKKYESWIVLQNCHLAASFLPELEQIIENMQPQTSKSNMQDQQMFGGKKEKEEAPPNPGFRIWLTSMSIDYFPQSILHASIKITSEPPKGIKAAMLRQYGMIAGNKGEKQTYEAHIQPERWRTLFLALSFFHAVVRERRRFGPLGWTKLYDFNDSDFRISMRQLYIMVEEFEDVPFAALQYLTGDCNYGGRVTDDRDRIALAAILKDFYTDKTYKMDEYMFAGESNSKYKIFNAPSLKEYLDYINSLPDDESPELMGLHENANISQAIYEASQIFANVLQLGQTANAEGGSSSQEQCRTMTIEILDMIREPYKIKEVEAIYPFRYEESMNSVLLQELARYNKLIEVMKSSLQTLLKTLDGKFVTTAEIEALKASILSNSIPERWKKASYQSRKPLLSYVADIQLRLKMLDEWIAHGKPNVFWISGFFFTQSFLTGIKQNFARKFNYPIDQVEFRFEILKYADAERAAKEPPQNGCFLKGLFLEGASWDDETGCLTESKRGEIFVSMPIINFMPKLIRSSESPEPLPCDKGDVAMHSFHYECPTYKTGERYGTLLTTGHSTNYVMNISLPSKIEPEHWVKRSVAMLMQLDT